MANVAQIILRVMVSLCFKKKCVRMRAKKGVVLAKGVTTITLLIFNADIMQICPKLLKTPPREKYPKLRRLTFSGRSPFMKKKRKT